MSRFGTYGSALVTAALAVLFTSVFFSSNVMQVGVALGWLSALAAWWTAREGDGASPRFPPVGLVLPLALFLLASALSASFSVAPATGWRLIWKEFFAMGLALAGASLASVARARLFLRIFLVAAAISGAWAIYQFVFEFHGVVDVDHRAYGFMRPWHFIWYAHVLTTAFAVALGLGIWSAHGDRMLAALSGAFAVVGMVMSLARASWLASLGLATIVSIGRRTLAPLVVVVVAVGALLVLPMRDALIARALSTFDVDRTAGANTFRFVRYQIGADVIRDYPLLGTGPRVYVSLAPRYARPGMVENTHLHNTFLQILVERGPLGLATWLLAMLWGLVNVVNASVRLGPERKGLAVAVALGLVAMLIVNNFDYGWDSWEIRGLMLTFLGLAWCPAITGAEKEEARAPTSTIPSCVASPSEAS